jgi:hypothetical protein
MENPKELAEAVARLEKAGAEISGPLLELHCLECLIEVADLRLVLAALAEAQRMRDALNEQSGRNWLALVDAQAEAAKLREALKAVRGVVDSTQFPVGSCSGEYLWQCEQAEKAIDAALAAPPSTAATPEEQP